MKLDGPRYLAVACLLLAAFTAAPARAQSGSQAATLPEEVAAADERDAFSASVYLGYAFDNFAPGAVGGTRRMRKQGRRGNATLPAPISSFMWPAPGTDNSGSSARR